MQPIPVKPKMHVFVCVNDRTVIDGNVKPSCGPTITKEQVKEVKQWILEQGLVNQVYCTATHCMGFCSKDGGNACAWPKGNYVKGLQNAEDIKKFLKEEWEKVN